MATARAVAEQAYAAMQAGDIDALTKLCSPDCELYDIGLTLRGPGEIGRYLQTYFVAFPDMRVEVLRLLDAGTSVAAEVRFTGTQTGPLATPNGEVPAAGRKMDMPAVDFMTVENGQITTWRVYIDTMEFMRQLGLMPEPAQAASV